MKQLLLFIFLLLLLKQFLFIYLLFIINYVSINTLIPVNNNKKGLINMLWDNTIILFSKLV